MILLKALRCAVVGFLDLKTEDPIRGWIETALECSLAMGPMNEVPCVNMDV